ncbi:MAG: hypothetical protein U0165_06750 [Polyangiaceae bacterium]
MSLLQRINPFWMGAGALLLLFNVNEIVAYRMGTVPFWLGGPVIHAATIFGALLGLAVMALLGIRPTLED